LISHKYLDDLYYKNNYIASVGGISTRELNYLECLILARLNFDLAIDMYEFNFFLRYINVFDFFTFDIDVFKKHVPSLCMSFTDESLDGSKSPLEISRNPMDFTDTHINTPPPKSITQSITQFTQISSPTESPNHKISDIQSCESIADLDRILNEKMMILI